MSGFFCTLFRHKVANRVKIATLALNGAQIMNTQLLQQARVLDIDEQIELDRRLADHLANPNDLVPWSEVKAAALSKTRQ